MTQINSVRMMLTLLFCLCLSQVSSLPVQFDEATSAVLELLVDVGCLQVALERWDVIFNSTFKPAMAEIRDKLEEIKVDPETLRDLSELMVMVENCLIKSSEELTDDFESLTVNLEFIASDLRLDSTLRTERVKNDLRLDSTLRTERVKNDLPYLDKFSGELEERYQIHKVTIDVAIHSANVKVETAIEDKHGYPVEEVRSLLDNLMSDLATERDLISALYVTYEEDKRRLWDALVAVTSHVSFVP